MRKEGKKQNYGLIFRNIVLAIASLFILYIFVFVTLPGSLQNFVVYENGEIVDTLDKDMVTTDWLDENFQCVKITCTYHYNDSQRAKVNVLNSSRTWNGPIEYTKDGSAIFFEPGAEIITKCGPCQEYQYGNYTILRK